MNNKKKRIAALVCALLLILLGFATLIFALIDAPWAYDLFKICLGGIIILPVLIYVYMLIARVLGGRGVPPEEFPENKDEQKNDMSKAGSRK